jgi:hypothetical protein
MSEDSSSTRTSSSPSVMLETVIDGDVSTKVRLRCQCVKVAVVGHYLKKILLLQLHQLHH